jgi:hypothetical protein
MVPALEEDAMRCAGVVEENLALAVARRRRVDVSFANVIDRQAQVPSDGSDFAGSDPDVAVKPAAGAATQAFELV